MTTTPEVRFAERPNPPTAGSAEYDRWTKESTLSYPGGGLTAAYGNLAQTLNMTGLSFQCKPTETTVSVNPTNVERVIGQPLSARKGYSYSLKKFSKKNASLAAAGLPVVVRTGVGDYTARLTGPMARLIDYFCDNKNLIFDELWVYSPKGAEYGPITPAES
jgi:hypothetical protein